MVSGAELAVIGTLSGAIVSGGVGLVRTRIQQGAETQRRYGESFLNKKVNALVEFHDSLCVCENKIDRFKLKQNSGPMSEFFGVEENDVGETMVDLFDKADKVQIFLSDEQNDLVDEALQGIISIYYEYSDVQYEEYETDEETVYDEEQSREHIEMTKSMLKEELNEPADFHS